MRLNYDTLGKFIRTIDVRNAEGKEETLLGVTTQKFFMPSIANTIGTDFSKYKIVRRGQFTYVPDTSRRGDRIAIALLQGWDEGLVSNIYTVFEVEDTTKLLPEYLMLWFNRPEFDRYARFKSHGSVREIFDWDEMCNVELPVPDISVQRSIVKAYNIIEERIRAKRELNDYLEQTVQAVYKNLFVDFKPFRDGEFVESRLGEIPVGWSIGLLSDLIDVKYGKDHRKLSDGKIPVYGSGGLMRHASSALYDGESILIPRKGTLNNIMYVNEAFWTVDTMFYSIMKMKNIATYVFHTVKSNDFTSMDVGSAVPSMTTDILNNIPVVIPRTDILVEFEAIISPMYKQLFENKKENMVLNSLRDTLLPKLMSGELSVVDL